MNQTATRLAVSPLAADINGLRRVATFSGCPLGSEDDPDLWHTWAVDTMLRILSRCVHAGRSAASLRRVRSPTPGDQMPAAFQRAVDSLRALRCRPEFAVTEVPAPQRLAPYAVALAAEVEIDDEEIAKGRLVVLHDPSGQEAWEGRWRAVVFAKATLEPEMASDPMLTDVGWAWLEEALADSGAQLTAFGGTVTRNISVPYGAMAGRDIRGDLELRASWTPTDEDISRHARAWLDLLATLAGLTPLPEGVRTLSR